MSTPFFQKHKVVLLRNAARRGPRVFLVQVRLVALDFLVRKKHLVFRADAVVVATAKVPPSEGVTFHELLSWAALSAVLARQPTPIPATIYLGDPDWFEKGWRLWIGEVEGRLACLGWLRTAEQSEDFFCRMLPGSELLWHATTVSDFLGRNLHVSLRIFVMRCRIAEGVGMFYTNCRDYNVPSHTNIRRMGFDTIGYATDSRWTGQRKWHPLTAEDAAAQ